MTLAQYSRHYVMRPTHVINYILAGCDAPQGRFTLLSAQRYLRETAADQAALNMYFGTEPDGTPRAWACEVGAQPLGL